MAKKKVVKQEEEIVCRVNVLEYFLSGKKEMDKTGDYDLWVKGNKLWFEGKESPHVIAIKDASGKIAINGDEDDWEDDKDIVLEELQNQKNTVTTSFRCIESAGINLDDIEIVHISEDLDKCWYKKDEGFADVEKNIPAGATLTVNRNYSKKTGRHSGAITYKRIHRAGSLLIKVANTYYICGQDDDSYFLSQLKTKPKTCLKAFQALVPSKVKAWEKKNGKQAERQGEWFFIPSDVKLKEENWFEDTALPMKSDESHPHTPSYIQSVKGKQYVKGGVYHEEHQTTYLIPNSQVFEAIESNHVDSWSVQGVD
jgi:hypothetical protein